MDDPYPSYFLLAQVTSYTFSYFLVNGLALLLLLVASALVSGSEVAFFSLGKDDLIELNQKNPEKGSVITSLLAMPKVLLSTILILNNLINIAIVTLTTFVTWTLFGTNATGVVIILFQTVGITLLLFFLVKLCQRSMQTKPRASLHKHWLPIYFSLPRSSSHFLAY